MAFNRKRHLYAGQSPSRPGRAATEGRRQAFFPGIMALSI